MRVAAVQTQDGASWIVRCEAETAIPIARRHDALGQDALRDLLGAGRDPADMPSVSDAFPLADCTWLAPVSHPQKIVAIGLNYSDHATEATRELPAAPVAFAKTANSLLGADDRIEVLNGTTTQLDFEVELAAIIGRQTRNIQEADALSAVFGYTVCNDITARDAQFSDQQWFRGKSFDGFCPLGPSIVTADEIVDPQDLRLTCRVNGTTVQDDTTANMLFGVAEIVSYLSRFMTLEPGDVIATGTPSGVGFARNPQLFLTHGDVVEAEVSEIGTLRSHIVQVEEIESPVGRLAPART